MADSGNLLFHDFSGMIPYYQNQRKGNYRYVPRTVDPLQSSLQGKDLEYIKISLKIYGFCSILMEKNFKAEFFQSMLNVFSHKCSMLSKSPALLAI